MTSRDFCYWLQGLFELSDPKALDERQTDLLRRHLAMVFLHEIDPSMGPVEHQEALDRAHAGDLSADREPPTALPEAPAEQATVQDPPAADITARLTEVEAQLEAAKSKLAERPKYVPPPRYRC